MKYRLLGNSRLGVSQMALGTATFGGSKHAVEGITKSAAIEAAAGGHNLSTDTLTSTVWVKQNGKWLAQLHTSIKTAQG